MRQTAVLPGHVDWSDDGSNLSYQGQGINMVDFQGFVQDQVETL
jgi:hypothetical protein